MSRAVNHSLKVGMAVFLTATCLSFAVSCGSSDSGSQSASPAQPPSENPQVADAQGSKLKYGSFACVESGDKKCFTEKYQEPATETKTVDILFVVQTSSSLAQERTAIADGIKNFIASLPAESSFNIGVMLAHGSTSVYSGKLYQAETEHLILKSSELAISQIQTELNAKLNRMIEDPNAGGGEEGLYSLYRGVTDPALLTDSQTAGFFRPTAALAVVFVADHRDICAIPSAGVPVETDPVKIAARIRDCEGLTAQGLTNRLKVLKGAQALAVSGIIYEQPIPSEDGNEVGYGYLDIINLNAGVTIDIANDDIAAGLASIAQLSGQQMVQQSVFTLSHSGVDPATLKVTVNGENVAYKLEGNVLTLTQKIPAGALVAISYCVKSLEESECTHKHGKGGGHHCDKARHPHGDETDQNGDGHPDQGKPKSS